MGNYYVTKDEFEAFKKVCDDEELDMISAMDQISPDEFWTWYGSPPEVVLESLRKRFDKS